MRFDGTAARRVFGRITTTAAFGSTAGGRARLRLAVPGRTGSGPDKYRVLEHRRRQAQIRARHLLDLAQEEPDATRL